MSNCIFCGREINNKGSLKSHEQCCKLNPNRISHRHSEDAGAKKGCNAWNKGLTKHSDSRIKIFAEALKNKFITGQLKFHGVPHTEETKKLLSIIAKDRNLGGYMHGSGRGKKGWYKGIFCDSSWELAYVIYCLDHKINILRNKEKRLYFWNDEERIYIPDFIVDGNIVEIKGYISKQWEAKIRSNPDILVLYKKDLKDVFEYVILTYGKNYINMYETGNVGESG